jgi:hypothetical protein
MKKILQVFDENKNFVMTILVILVTAAVTIKSLQEKACANSLFIEKNDRRIQSLNDRQDVTNHEFNEQLKKINGQLQGIEVNIQWLKEYLIRNK